jgi:hypothetical protein
MLTLFSIPKAFEGHIGIIQRNALESWSRLQGTVQVILMGNDPGVSDAASEWGFEHAPDIERTKSNVPLVNSIFSTAQSRAQFPIRCYVNADIILPPNFLDVLIQVNLDKFLLVGSRWNLDLDRPLKFDADWQHSLRWEVEEKGKRAGRYAIDYFVFSGDVFGEIPPFAIGRFHWDNWLLFRARNRRVPVIDASERILAVHQNHGYGESGRLSELMVRESPEARNNRRLTGGYHHGLDLCQATWRLTKHGMERQTITQMGFRNWFLAELATRPFLFRCFDYLLVFLEAAVPEFLKSRLRPLLLQ